MKRIIITVHYDVTDVLPDGGKKMSDDEIKEFFADTPEVLDDADPYYEDDQFVLEVDRRIE